MDFLLHDIETVRQFVPALNAQAIDEETGESYIEFLLPAIRNIERGFIRKKLLGADLYKLLLEFSQSGQSDSSGSGSGSGVAQDLFPELLLITQEVIANMAVLKWSYQASVRMSTSGLHRTETEGNLQAYHYQILEARQEIKESGYEAALELWEFLEENKSEFPDWTATDIYKKRFSYFITKPSEFLYKKRIDYLVYTNILGFMELVEDTTILAAIGRPFFDELKTQIVVSNLSAANQKVMPLLRKAVSYFSAAAFAEQSGIELTDKGFFFVSVEASGKNIKSEKQVKGQNLHPLIESDRRTAENYLDQLRRFLHENISNYPTYANSDAYNGGERLSFSKDKKIVPLF